MKSQWFQVVMSTLVIAALGLSGTMAGAEPGQRVERLRSGLQITHLIEGKGSTPGPSDMVKVDYHGTLVNGTIFDSTRGDRPRTFRLSGVIPCWTEGLQRMKVGGKARFRCPAKIAYGLRGSPPDIPPNATLMFDVELLIVY